MSFNIDGQTKIAHIYSAIQAIEERMITKPQELYLKDIDVMSVSAYCQLS